MEAIDLAPFFIPAAAYTVFAVGAGYVILKKYYSSGLPNNNRASLLEQKLEQEKRGIGEEAERILREHFGKGRDYSK